MEPISLIIAALVAGATAAAKDTAEKTVKDAYEGLKTLIKRKFEGDSLAQGLVDAKPEEIKQVEGLLKDKISKAGIDRDEEVLKVAEEIMKQEDPDGFQDGKDNINVKVGGDVIGVAGKSIGTVNVGGVHKG